MFGKLGFVHRRLWARDVTYRAALLAGPAPLLGLGIAAAIWFAIPHGGPAPTAAPVAPPPPWVRVATPPPAPAPSPPPAAQAPPPPPALPPAPAAPAPLPTPAPSSPPAAPGASAAPPQPRTPGPIPTPPQAVATAAPPIDLAPDAQLPANFPANLVPGWQGHVNPVVMTASHDADIQATALAPFTLDGPAIDLNRIVAAGPRGGLFVGVTSAFILVRTPGIHALTLHVTRDAADSVDCVQRLGFGRRRLVASLVLGIQGNYARTYPPTRFTLSPGLYQVTVAFGCWRNGQTVGPGTATLLMQRPGEAALRPIGASDLLRPRS